MSDEREVQDWLEARSDRVIETSCARVYLKGETALKVKRPVDFGFLDFSTLEKRQWALGRELAFNKPFAPDIYHRVRTITREAGGDLALDGAGSVVDVALEMRRFDPAQVLAEQPEALTGDIAEALGRRIARGHIAARVVTDDGGAKALGYTIRTNGEHMLALKDKLGAALVERVVAATDAELARRTPLLEARRAAGFSRHCHGDLHLGNILLEDGEPKPFDCIEFNDLLSEIDTLYDLAFTLMDLSFRGRTEAANRVMNAYLDEAYRRMPAGLLEGLAALPLMLSARASVRSHVDWHGGEHDKARAYLAAADAHLRPSAARLVAIGGLSGSGKTTVARLAAPAIGSAPGAVVLRSDEVRKRVLGLASDAPAPRDAYSVEAMDRAYAQLWGEARRVLTAGRSVVLDATFLNPAHRAVAEAVARDVGVAFDGVWLTAPVAILEARVDTRRGDASDATVATLREQLGRDRGEISWREVDATDFESAAKAVAGN